MRDSHPMYVGFAAGRGIGPALSTAKSLLEANETNQFILFYGNRRTDQVMYLEELMGLKNLYLDRLALHFLMSQEPQEVELYNGRIDALRVREFARVLFDPQRVAGYFISGPGDMIEQVTAALRELSVSADRIHGEHFAVSGEQSTGTQPSTPDSCEITIIMDGRRRTFSMGMDDGVVLDAAMRAGIELPFSCRAGVCSTCRTKVVSGEVEMDQNYALEEWELEQGYVLACQSRVKTPTLELDYDEK
jgi:ring-1,2-phenylacetyl-CoA epoxidase subunit PaaE